MKTGILAAILISTAIIAHAQKKITEGTAIYSTTYSPTAEQEAAVAMLPTEQKLQFNGNIVKMQMEQGPATITILGESTTRNATILIDVPVAQMQFAVKQTKADYDKARATVPKFSDFKATGEKKTIAGYNAEKYSYKDDKGATYELWATNDIEFPTGFFGDEFAGVKGVLVQYTHFQQGVKTTLTLKSLAEDKQGPFTLDVPSGYELKTMEEIMAMSGGGQ